MGDIFAREIAPLLYYKNILISNWYFPFGKKKVGKICFLPLGYSRYSYFKMKKYHPYQCTKWRCGKCNELNTTNKKCVLSVGTIKQMGKVWSNCTVIGFVPTAERTTLHATQHVSIAREVCCDNFKFIVG